MRRFLKRLRFRLLGKKMYVVFCEQSWNKNDYVVGYYGPGGYAREYLVAGYKKAFGGYKYKLKYLDI